MGQEVDENGYLTTTTSTTTTTTTTTTTSRSRGPSPNPDSRSVADSGYSSTSPTTPRPPQQPLPGPDRAAPPTAIHPAFRGQNPPELRHLQAASEEQERRNGQRGKDPLLTIRESRTLSDRSALSSQPDHADQTARPSALGNFKAAGTGLLDVRDSVRSMYHAEQDRHYSKKPSARDLKNQASAPQISSAPNRPDWDFSNAQPNTAAQGYTQPRQPDVGGQGNMQPSQQLNYSSSNSTMGQSSEYGGGRSRRKSLGQVPASFSPESTGTAAQKEHEGSLRRLLRGRH